MINKSIALVVCFLIGMMPAVVFSALQVVSPSSSSFTVAPGGTVEFTVIYQASSPRPTSGLGVQLYYDSSKLTFTGASQIYAQDSAGLITSVDDTANEDGDASTDKKIPAGWASLAGNWPSISGDVTLFKATFVTDAGFASGTTDINVRGEPAVGHQFITAAAPVTVLAIARPQTIPTLGSWGITLLILLLVFASWRGLATNKIFFPRS